MTEQESKSKLDESVQFFEEFINSVLKENIEGVEPFKVLTHYNTLRTELSKLYVDIE